MANWTFSSSPLTRTCCCVRPGAQLRGDLSHLARMPRLVTANKQQPLIEIDRPQHRMRLNDFAESQTVSGHYAGAERGTRLLQSCSGRCRIEFAVWTNLIGSIAATTAIGDQCQVKATEHRRRFQLRPDSRCFRVRNPLGHTHADTPLNHDEVLQYLRH